MMTNTRAIVLENVSRLYPGGVRAVDDVSLHIQAGEWVALMGPSGSGKTTLLNLIDGLDRPSSGNLCILGQVTTRFAADEAATFRRENLGLIFQQFHLIPYLTALENVMVAQYYHSLVDKEQALRALDAVQMTERAHHLPSQLSGGEQQRLCIARALINEPRILLADEPTANLDEANEAKVFEIFQTLHEQGKTIVVATHDPALGSLAQRKALLRHGRLVEDQRNHRQPRVLHGQNPTLPTNRFSASSPATWQTR
jgi:putative ABC transport system ATP-binding protein